MIAIGSPALGIVSAFATAMIFKYADMRTTGLMELSLYMLLMYIPFVLAEVCHLSGIVTIFFSGMSARRYIEPNVSDETKKTAENIFQLAAYLAETCIFLALGLSVFGLKDSFEWKFTIFAFLAALLGRASSIYPLSFMFNLSLKEQVVIDDTQLLDQHEAKENQRDSNKGDTSETSSVASSSTAESQASNNSPIRFPRKKKRKTPEKRRDKKICLLYTSPSPRD